MSSRGPRLVLIGKQGAGKGTQAVRVAESFGVMRLATGDLFRTAINEGTEIGVEAAAFINRGELVPDESVIDLVPDGPLLLVKEGQTVTADQPLTTNPNVGGFGQKDVEIVLQNPARIQGLLVFFVTVLGGQVLLVLKKKQFEKVQLAEMNF